MLVEAANSWSPSALGGCELFQREEGSGPWFQCCCIVGHHEVHKPGLWASSTGSTVTPGPHRLEWAQTCAQPRTDSVGTEQKCKAGEAEE